MEGTTETMLRVAVSYAQQNWAVIPVHGVDGTGVCSCKLGGACLNPGKHPIQAGWTKGAALSVPDLYTVWQDHPGANVGLRTGDVSGFFVLDVEADGLDELAALEAIHGKLPVTFTVRTGGGGLHYYFAMPDFPIKNNARKLAPHIDVRGTGGQVVAAGSTSGKGAYVAQDDVPVAPAPGWLLELLRAPADAPDTTDTAVVEDLPRHDELEAHDQERAQKYAVTVLRDEASQYRNAVPGSGNDSLFRAACNVLEIVQSPWNTYTVGDAWDALEGARVARIGILGGDHGQTAQEFAQTFQSARGQVIGQGRELPADPTADRYAGVMFDPGPEYAASVTVGAGSVANYPSSLKERLRAELLTANQVACRPNPRPLVNGLLDLDSEAWMIGKPGTFKSFVALDLAGHIGLGKPWGGRRVHQGTVLYIVAEGVNGMTLRVRAWQDRYGPMDGVYFLPRPVQVNGRQGTVSEGWQALVELAAELEPALVVIDTQARVTVGLKENDATDLGVYVEAVRLMREATTGCVLTIHHIGRNGTDSRGSNAIDGAQGTELRLDRKDAKGRQVELIMDKQKDMADSGDPLLVDLAEWEDGVDPETGRVISSLVAVAGDEFMQPQRQAIDVAAMIEEERQGNAGLVLAVIRDTFNEHDDWTRERVQAVCKERYSGRQAGWTANGYRKTFERAWGRLVKLEAIEPVTASRWRYVPPEDRSRPAPAGLE